MALALVFFFVAGIFFFRVELAAPGRLSTEPKVDPAGVLQVWSWQQITAAAFARGRFPLWNSHTFFGQPHLANVQTAVFFPLTLLAALADSPRANDLFLVLRLALAGFFLSLLLRRLGAGVFGALAAGLAYAYGGYGLWFVQLVDLNSQMLLPLLLLALDRLSTRRGIGAWVLSAFLFAGVFLGGHPEAAFNTTLAALGYLVFRRLTAPDAVRPALWPALAAALGGGMLALLVLLPFAGYLDRSWSMHAPGFGFFHLEARGILNLFWPGVHRVFADQPSAIPLAALERGTLGLLAAPYRETAVPGVPPGLGIFPLLLALAALLRLKSLPPTACFFAALLALTLGVTFGLPGFRLIALLPVFNRASNFKFYFSEIHFCLAALIGFAVGPLAQKFSARYSGKIRALASPALLIGLAAALLFHARDVRIGRAHV